MTAVPHEKMMCHYEVMDLPMTCKIEDIKKAYKLLALKYHPDRNHGNEEDATKKFKQLSAAYAVLSDPQERKWYDDHRDAILRGGDGTAARGEGDDEEDDPTGNLWKYFNSSCYSGAEDADPDGFYGVYGNAFGDIEEQENNRTKVDINATELNAPSIGDSTVSISEVLKFYNFWENFSSTLTFAWVDSYNTTDAPNRQVRRQMEKENQKARDTARREYTNQVRSLAGFVKKRDPRYIAYIAEINRKKAEEEELKAKLKLEEQELRKQRREELKQKHENDDEYYQEREKERTGAFLLGNLDSDADSDGEEGEGRSGFRRRKGKNSRNTKLDASGGPSRGDSQKEALSSMDDMAVQQALRQLSIASSAAEGAPAGTEAVVPEEAALEAFVCTVCDRSFDTDAGLAAHNNNKQHRNKMKEFLRAQKKEKS